MSSMGRTRGYWKGGARKLALTVVPLAAIAVSAVPARADINPFLYNSSGSFYINGSATGSVSCFAPADPCSPGPFSGSAVTLGANGISLSGFATGSHSGPGNWDIIWDFSGYGGGEPLSVPTDLDVSLDFQPSVAPIAWALTVTIDGVQTVIDPAVGGGPGPPPPISDTGTISLPLSITSINTYSVKLDVTFASSVSTAEVAIPSGASVDLSAVAAPVPEPSGLLLLFGFGSVVGLLARQRSRATRA
jgi:hypothetical protein